MAASAPVTPRGTGTAAGMLVPPSAADTPLFGGALAVSLPDGWLDCSDARPVPDHQEVWLEREGQCRSLIIEILERAEEASDDKCAIYHFVDIAEANNAAGQRITYTDALPPTALRPSLAQAVGPCFALHGVQILPPDGAASRLGREPPAEAAQAAAPSSGPHAGAPAGTVQLELSLAVLRLPRQSTDLLVSVNRARPLPGTDDAPGADREAAEAQQLVDAKEDAALLASVVGTLEVRDWGLFGE